MKQKIDTKIDDEVKIIVLSTPTPKQEQEINALGKITFVDVDEVEAKEDFYHPMVVQVLAYAGDKLVGWAGVHQTEQEYLGKRIKLGGYGICTHPDWQRKGIASRVAQKAMVYLKEHGTEVGFLSVDPGNVGSVKLHQKFGFKLLSQKFSWTNSLGELKKDSGGMVAPINSDELFSYIMDNNDEALYTGNGYW